jgi:hypothetical protein
MKTPAPIEYNLVYTELDFAGDILEVSALRLPDEFDVELGAITGVGVGAANGW